MPTKTRRGFLATTACSGACLLASAAGARGEERSKAEGPRGAPDLEALAYCSADCRPERCPFHKASLADDREFKSQVAARWQKKLGRSVPLDEVFCFGCRVPPAKQGHGVKTCTVRACVVERKLVSCVRCPELATCQKELWTNYPDFRAKVLEIRRQVRG
jgi:hypothetical protein